MKKKNPSRGTPETLNQTLQNAFIDYKKEGRVSESRLRKLVLIHVRDFIRNKLAPISIMADNEYAVEDLIKQFVKSLK